MKRAWKIVMPILILAGTAGAYGVFASVPKSTPKEDDRQQARHSAATGNEPVALVETVPLKKGLIMQELTVYGEIVPAPGATQAVSVPFGSQVRRIMVSDGQEISQNDPLMEIEPSPDTYLQLEQARNTYEIKKESLKHVEERFHLKLATNDQLLQARQALQQAELRLESMKKQGIDGKRLIRADLAGLIKKVYVQEGAIVPAGNPLVEIIARNRLEARLGVEPGDINRVQANQPVFLERVNATVTHGVKGRIREMSRSLNPATRLIDVFVSFPSSADFLLGESVVAKMTIASSQGLIVPRSAVLPEGDRYILFMIKGGRAVKHIVQVGLENEKEVEIIGSGLRPGNPVAALGNYELKDGMAVKIKGTL